jgi:galactokinase
MSEYEDPTQLLIQRFGAGAAPSVVTVPGRVNLIGEHVDYHNLPVLPMAMQRSIRVAYRVRKDRHIRAASDVYGDRAFEWTPQLQASAPGDWVNYVKAAAQAVEGKWRLDFGIDAAVVSDLPPAAGLSSSSALLVAFTLALLRANGIEASFEELMDVLPEGEYFVGTRGGGMDHAAVLAGRPGCALLIHFSPVAVTPVPIPLDWGFLVAHSLSTAEKSGAVKAEYNSRRTAGSQALKRLGFSSFKQAVEQHGIEELKRLAFSRLDDEVERRCFLHVATEATRVGQAVDALHRADAAEFGRILNAGHASVRDDLRISCPALDALTAAALASGALGARLTGAGFGGCAVVFCHAAERERVAAGLVERYYSKHAGFDPAVHLMEAIPSGGALFA